MINKVVLVGRLTNKPKIKNQENGAKNTVITLALPRNYKNENGEYDTDFIDVILYSNIAENTTDYCNTGDIIGINGRIETSIDVDITTQEKTKTTYIIAERVTFLSKTKKEEKNEG